MTVLTLPVEAWSEREFSGSSFSDERMSRRAVAIGSAMARHPGRGLPQMFGRVSEVRAAYRFMKHEEATPANIQYGHRERVWSEMGAGWHLLLEDTSEILCSRGEEIEGLGPIGGSRTRKIGFLLHTTLAVRWDGSGEGVRRPAVSVVGIADQSYRIREPQPGRGPDRGSRRRQVGSGVESGMWEEASRRLGRPPEGARWIKVGDRGADIYDHLMRCRANGQDFVIRAQADRVIEGVAGRLFAAARATVAKDETSALTLRRRGQTPKRTAHLSVSVTVVRIQSPQVVGFRRGARPALTVTLVRAWEADPPSDATPLEWILLTSLPVETTAQAWEIIRMYATRWLEEEFHKALKTGLGLERQQMESADAWFAVTALMSVVAVRLIALREVVRAAPAAPADQAGLTQAEQMVLSARSERPLKTVRDVALALARLGGHMNRAGDGLPGWIVLWRGWQVLQNLMEGFYIARKSTFCG